MTDIPPKNAAEAQTRLDARLADPEWSKRFSEGGSDQKREFQDLTARIARGDAAAVSAAMNGKFGDVPTSQQRQIASAAEWFRELGVRDEVAQQFMSGAKVSPEELGLVQNWKTAAMADKSFVDRYLSGDADAKMRMTIANTVLVNGAKESAT